MSQHDNSHCMDDKLIKFETTNNMKNAGISDLSLNKEFIIKFDAGGICAEYSLLPI